MGILGSLLGLVYYVKAAIEIPPVLTLKNEFKTLLFLTLAGLFSLFLILFPNIFLIFFK
jgi:hypothetical protein